MLAGSLLLPAAFTPALAEPLDEPRRVLTVSAPVAGQSELAAHLETSGHWSFVNRAGERFTASGPAELQLAVQTLSPEVKASGARLVVYLSRQSLSAPVAELAALPKEASLRGVLDDGSVPVLLRPAAPPVLVVTPGVALVADPDRAFVDAYRQLVRRVPEFHLRVLALEPGAPRVLSSSPRADLKSKQTLVDAVDPSSVVDALSGVARQTVLIKGRLDGDDVFTRGERGPEMRVSLRDLERAAAASDVTLFVHGSTAAQPGGRNWLWLPVFDGVPTSGASLRVVDLITSVSAGTPLVIAAESRDGRLRLTARPAEADSGRSQAEVWLRRAGDAAKELFGASSPRLLVVSLPSFERQTELSRRIIGWLPSTLQFGYAGLLAVGLLGLPVARRWFLRIWPLEQGSEYAGAAGHYAARAIRALVFALVFVPLVAIFALPAQLLHLLTRSRKAHA